ncbi:hypothetical protein AAG906_017140 [Vitis piasezkii]
MGNGSFSILKGSRERVSSHSHSHSRTSSLSPSTSPWVVCTVEIDIILRDSHGIAQVKSVTGSQILRVLKGHGLAPEVPENLYHLIKKAVAIRKHLERNRKDKDSKVPIGSCGEQDSPTCPLLQEKKEASSSLEIRVYHCHHSRGLG